MGTSALVALSLLASALPEGPGALGKVAVLEVQAAEGLDLPWLPIFSEVLTTELANSGRFTSVIGSRDVRAMLSFEAQRQIMGCDDEACLAEIGGALGADRIVVADIAALGGRHVLTLKLIHLTEARTDARAYESVSGGEAAVLDAAPRLVRALLGEAPPPTKVGAVTRDAPETQASLPVVPISLFAVSAAGFGMAVGFGLDMAAKRDAAIAAEAYGSQKEIAAGKRSALLANVGFGIGATALVAGALWWWLDDDPDPGAVALGPWATSNGAGATVGGHF